MTGSRHGRRPARGRPASRAALTAGVAVCLLLALPGCLPSAAMLLVSAAGSLAGGGGTGGAGARGAGDTARPGTGAQNGRALDESIGQALQASSLREPLESCRSSLPEPVAGEEVPTCSIRPVCLPGARAPTELMVCRSASVPRS